MYQMTTINPTTEASIHAYHKYLVLRNFQPSTTTMYCRAVRKYYEFCDQSFQGEPITQDLAQEYLLTRLQAGKSWSTINAEYSALRKYFKVILSYPWSLTKMPRPKRDKALPAILSKEEVAKLISHAPTFKHQVFLSFLYGTGVRLSEATHVKLNDIDSKRMQIHIHRGKGAKDRKVLLNDRLLDLLRSYYKVYHPTEYLFNGQKKGHPYSSSAAQWSIRRGRSLAGITRRCTIHTLRNCYATHHLELGTDLVFLQEQLGHKNLKTTAKYIRLCIERYRNICHPIDHITIQYRKPQTTSVRSSARTVKPISKRTIHPSTISNSLEQSVYVNLRL